MSWWEIEKDPHDLQLDLLRDGQTMAFGLADETEVAQAISKFKNTDGDMIEDHNGREYTVPEFLSLHG